MNRMMNPNTVISDFKGVYARVARRLKMSPSMVSRVARGERSSPAIEKALSEELKLLKNRLETLETSP